MKFGQLIKYDMRNIILEKPGENTQNVVIKLVPDPFLES